MKFSKYEQVLSSKRLKRYKDAYCGNTRKAMALYRYNLRLSQEMFTIISCFEVALRNAIDNILVHRLGNEWLKDSAQKNGCFDNPQCSHTQKIILKAYNGLIKRSIYSHSKLIAEMEFGVWKYMFSAPQFRATQQCLLKVFPQKPVSSATQQYNHTYLFNELDKINSIRNRIAHHEPICFRKNTSVVDSSYVLKSLTRIQTLLYWMGIDADDMLFGLNHVKSICNKIDNL